MQIKGSSLVATERFVKQRFGSDGYQRLLQVLPKPSREIYENPIIATQWYPINEGFYQPLEAICRLFFDGQPRGARETGNYSAREGLRGVYRIFVRIASVDFILKKTPSIFATYYQPGRMEVLESQARRVVLRMTGVDEPHPLLEERICGWLEGAAEVCGERNCRVSLISSMAQGDQYTDFEAKF
jgi:hypothetical protein